MEEVKRGSRGEEVYQLIKRKIITMELKPGTFVNERDLQDHFGIGRTPIREALLKLKGDNLVESSPNKSTYVKEITLKSVKDFFEPFVEMEKLIGRLAARRRDPGVLREIRSAHRYGTFVGNNLVTIHIFPDGFSHILYRCQIRCIHVICGSVNTDKDNL